MPLKKLLVCSSAGSGDLKYMNYISMVCENAFILFPHHSSTSMQVGKFNKIATLARPPIQSLNKVYVVGLLYITYMCIRTCATTYIHVYGN